MAAKMAMIAMTTSNSINVNPLYPARPLLRGLLLIRGNQFSKLLVLQKLALLLYTHNEPVLHLRVKKLHLLCHLNTKTTLLLFDDY